MKKLILIAVAAIAGTQANAQFSINPEAGVNFANMSIKSGNSKGDTKSITGYKVGALVNIDIAKGFYIEPGVCYSIKGYSTAAVLGTTTKTTFDYLEIPLNLGYRYDLGNAGAIFATAGPYVGLGMKGKTKIENSLATVENDIKFGDGITETKKLDYGANFSVGYISPIGIYLRAQYGLGLANLSNVNDASAKHGVFGLSVGYSFQLNER
jgi:hypothetical protein